MMKNFRSRHADLSKGEDVLNPKHLIKSKEKRLTHKMKNSTREESKSGPRRVHEPFLAGAKGKQYSQKVRNKIIAGMRPTRSKTIIKGGRDGFGSRGKSRGGKR